MKRLLVVGLTVVLSASVVAEPIVINDYGGRDSGVPNAKKWKEDVNGYKPLPFDDRTRYPIRSQLQPGYLDKPQKLRQPVKGAQPFFVIGNDDFSKDWIEKNKRYLQKIGAQGLATNIASKNEFDALASLVSPLPLVAVPIDEIAKILNFNMYPVLVTGEEIAQ